MLDLNALHSQLVHIQLFHQHAGAMVPVFRQCALCSINLVLQLGLECKGFLDKGVLGDELPVHLVLELLVLLHHLVCEVFILVVEFVIFHVLSVAHFHIVVMFLNLVSDHAL